MSYLPKAHTRVERRALIRALPLLPFCAALPGSSFALPSGQISTEPGQNATQSAVVPFLGKRNLAPGQLVGTGLNGRMTFDLAQLKDGNRVVRNDEFFVRTRFPDGLQSRKNSFGEWVVLFSAGEDASGHFRDFGGPDTEITVASLRQRAKPMGEHLLECSGNSRPRGFGLLSMAEWSGVSLRELCSETLSNVHRGTQILVTGNDDHSEPSRNSTQGASWVFTIEQIQKTGAFLATEMNGQPLPMDHGGPVRLIMPGWYGCTNIKWVESVQVVRQDHPSTSQMREFASRTHQAGQPELANEYLPAEIDFAGMPVSVSGPDASGFYDVHGLSWGDPTGVESIYVRYSYADGQTAELPVKEFVPQKASSWTTWQQRFQPTRKGKVDLTVHVSQADVRTRRLDKGYYSRSIEL